MLLTCDRYWLLTWTTYGTWLPGDQRGFVSPVKVESGPRQKHNQILTEYNRDAPGLARSARAQMKGVPIFRNENHAPEVLAQCLETAEYRSWQMLAVAIMRNHVHLVVGVPGDPDPADLLRDFKSYSSRRLNREFGKAAAGRWWTESGSRRILKGQDAVSAGVRYVLEQDHPLVVWSCDDVDELESIPE